MVIMVVTMVVMVVIMVVMVVTMVVMVVTMVVKTVCCYSLRLPGPFSGELKSQNQLRHRIALMHYL